MAYGDSDRTRRLLGNVATGTVSAADVTQAIAVADSYINVLTGKSDWVAADDAYELIQGASEYLAAGYLMGQFAGADYKDKAEFLWEHGKELAGIAKMNSNNTVFIATQTYRTHPLNSSATPYKSLSGANNSTDDSDL